jgi:class 3 adenylate cyclase
VGVRFCEECGSLTQRVERAPATVKQGVPGEERRLVTALFCDLVGFTPLAERLDPEEVREIQAAYFGAMSTHIARYGGIVEKYAGDAVLALFGAPTAHEDDGERAVLCAIGMQAAIEPVATRARERWDVGLAIRIGVNTGEVVSGTWDASGRQDTAVTGDALNTAARIEAAAEPGEILVGAETMRLAQRRIRFGERRDLSLKGKTAAVAAYPVLGLRGRLAERWETRAERTPLTGRDPQLSFLLDAWQRAHAGEGQLISLLGDAGVGKSRLVSELVEKVLLHVGTGAAVWSSTDGPRVQVARGRCLSYGQEISLWLVADLVRGLFEIGEQDSIDEKRSKLAMAVTSLLTENEPEALAADLAVERQVAIDVLAEVLGSSAGGSIVGKADARYAGRR